MGILVDHSVNGELLESGNLRRSIREQVKYARIGCRFAQHSDLLTNRAVNTSLDDERKGGRLWRDSEIDIGALTQFELLGRKVVHAHSGGTNSTGRSL